MKNKKKTITEEIKEYTPEVKSWEVADYENRFREKVHHDVEFDKQDENGYSMKLYKGESGVEALWSGVIRLEGDSHVKWKFSLQNGVFADAQIMLNEENDDILVKLYEFYKTWQDEWSKVLTLPQGKETEEEKPEPLAEPLAESIKKHPRKKIDIIDNHSSRMKKLAGL